MSSNLNTLLKQQIKDAIHAIYNNQGSEKAHAYTTSDEVSKALLDILFPAEVAHNTEVTGVVRVPTVHDEAKPASDSESTDSKKERKKRAPMSDEAKAAMKAKREATIAAKKAAAEPVPAPAAEPVPAPAEAAPEEKERKKRGPMSDEAKAQMKAKREATIAAKKAAV
jgi:hypothetical protein